MLHYPMDTRSFVRAYMYICSLPGITDKGWFRGGGRAIRVKASDLNEGFYRNGGHQCSFPMHRQLSLLLFCKFSFLIFHSAEPASEKHLHFSESCFCHPLKKTHIFHISLKISNSWEIPPKSRECVAFLVGF